MTKSEFLDCLGGLISEYPSDETNKSLDYYSEMIDDRIEDGMTEAEAIASLGSVHDIANQIKCELPLTTLVKQKALEKTKGEGIPVWVIVLLVLGAPVWIPLAISISAVLLSIYITVWAFNFAFWVADLSIGISSIVTIFAAIISIFTGGFLSFLIYLGGAIVLAGLAIILAIGCFYMSKGIIAGTVWLFKQLKKSIVSSKEA